ncbi:MAG: ATP-binding cassette domain-containing protein [Oscillospiraceae bacterium]|nr:ATP-binding cassette domain-containing protein [Oscillospiraceae bacterium]
MMEHLLEAKELSKYYTTPNGPLHAVEQVSFTVDEKTTLGVVGESGCGKSTLGRVLVGLLDATGGDFFFEGENVTHPDKKKRKELRRKMQIIFQDPYSSLDPRMCVSDLIAEPLKALKLARGATLEKKVQELMDTVGLARRFAYSYPHELDGGRRQRIGIARALSVDPKFIVCDEPVSALDVSIQAQVLNLLKELQIEKGLTYVFITHNLSVVKHISHDILVMYCGCMVEKCPSKELFAQPLHPYTKGLLAAIPIPSLHVKKPDIVLSGEVTSPVNPKPGCRFAARCPYVSDLCKQEMPKPQELAPGHFVACHRAKEINSL